MKFKKIKNLRIEHNLNQEELAQILEVNRSTYTGWELGTNTIPLRKLFELSNYYKVSIDYITGLNKNNNYIYSTDKINFKIVGKNLKELRNGLGLTQKDIANLLKISVSSYTLYELGKILIPTSYIYKLAKKFECSIDEIIKKY